MRFEALRTQIRSYLDLVWWTTKDAARPLPWSSITMIGGGFAAIALQVNGVALTVLFARSLTSDAPLTLGPVALHPRASSRDLVFISIAILASMLLSTGARYAARLAELRIRERYADRCWTRGVRLVRGPNAAPPGPVPYHLAEVQRLVRGDALLCSRFAVLLLQTTVSGGKLLAACITLLVVNPLLTLAILGIGTVFGGAAYRVNLRSARVSLAFEDSVDDARDETRQLLLEAGASFRVDREIDLPPDAMPAKSRYLSLYARRLRTSDEGEAIGNLMLSTVLFLTVLGIGLQREGWKDAATFLIALPYALLAFRELMRTSTSLNRFYPQVRRYRTFIDSFHEHLRTASPPDSLSVGFPRHAERRASPIPGVVLRAGDIAVVENAFVPDRHTAAWLAATISEKRDGGVWVGHVVVVTSRWPFDRQRLADLGWTPEEFDGLVRLLDAEGRPQQLHIFDPGDHLPREESASRPLLRLLVAVVLAARSRPGSLVMIDGRDASRLSPEGFAAIRRLLSSSILLVIVPSTRPPLSLPPDTPALIVGRTGLTRIERLQDWGVCDAADRSDEDGNDLIDDEDDSALDVT